MSSAQKVEKALHGSFKWCIEFSCRIYSFFQCPPKLFTMLWWWYYFLVKLSAFLISCFLWSPEDVSHSLHSRSKAVSGSSLLCSMSAYVSERESRTHSALHDTILCPSLVAEVLSTVFVIEFFTEQANHSRNSLPHHEAPSALSFQTILMEAKSWVSCEVHNFHSPFSFFLPFRMSRRCTECVVLVVPHLASIEWIDWIIWSSKLTRRHAQCFQFSIGHRCLPFLTYSNIFLESTAR